VSPADSQAPGPHHERQLPLAPATPVACWAYAAVAIALLALAAALWRTGVPQACCASWWHGTSNVALLLFFGGAAGYVLVSVLADALEGSAESAIGRCGQEAAATITWSEEYMGDGDHPGDPCFRGTYSYQSADGRLHRGSFRGYSYDPMDIAWAGDSIQRIRDCYDVGRLHRVVYLPRMTRVHVFQLDREAGHRRDAPDSA
jgi:hypothetical protein